MKQYDTPILIIAFNRAAQTRILIEAIRKVAPRKLFISLDGPRPHIPDDAKKCRDVRDLFKDVGWPCEVKMQVSETNLGGNIGTEKAISWFFRQVEEGLIFEDDCIPNEDFFRFAGELLERYRNDPTIMVICGTNFQNGMQRGNTSYYFSNYIMVWGYAMWKRTWNIFDSRFDGLDDFIKNKKIKIRFHDKYQRKYWLGFFKKSRRGKFIFIDSRLLFSIWNAGGISIIPNVNLVKNIGFGKDATNTVGNGKNISLETETLGMLKHPSDTHPNLASVDREADDYFFDKVIRTSFFKKLKHKLLMLYLRR
jgi:hypothetical protein